MTETKQIRKRSARAWDHRRKWDHLLVDVYKYVIPYRNAGDNVITGQKLNDELFDATAVDSAFRFAGRMQQQLTPPFQKFFELAAGPGLKKALNGDVKKINMELNSLADQVHAGLQTSDFHTATPEMYLDLFAGTGAMLMLEGDQQQPIRVLSVPIYEVAIELGPWGKIWGRHWRRRWPVSQVQDMWPRGTLSKRLRDKLKEDPDELIEICQSTVWNDTNRRWTTIVFADDEGGRCGDGGAPEPAIFEEQHRTSPWITPRFFVVPGEAMGRGPALIAMPNIKCVNKARELDLQAAALALFGIWTARDDEVFNADTARMEAGAIWSVTSNATGGAYGPSIAKLDVPGNYDLSRFITDDEREQINMMTFNRRLPPESGAVRSPTEILERIRDLDLDMSGVFGRLAMEIVQPTVERAIEILSNLKVIDTAVSIDQLIVGLRVVSPLARAQMTADAKGIVDYVSVVSSLFGPDEVPVAIKKDEMLRDLGPLMGVEEKYIPSKTEQEQYRKQQRQAAELEIAAKAGAIKADGESEGQALNGAGVQ